MNHVQEKIRICSSGSNGSGPDEIDSYTTAYIQRFCSKIEALINREEKPGAETGPRA
jgi:hypothetical protein